MSTDDLLRLANGTEEEQKQFDDIAKKAGTTVEKFRKILEKTVATIEETRFRQSQTPKATYKMEAREILTHKAYEEVMGDFEFLTPTLPADYARGLRDKASELLQFSIDERGEQGKELKSRAAQRVYRRAYVIDAFTQAKVGVPEEQEDYLKIVCAKGKDFLEQAYKAVNSDVERAAIRDAEKVLTEYEEFSEKFKKYCVLFNSYRAGTLDSDQQLELAILLQKARTIAVSNKNVYNLWYRFSIEQVEDIIAANMLQKEPYYVAQDDRRNVTDIGGYGERFGVAGSEIGGQFSYESQRRSRPHRDDDGNYGGRDEL